MSIDARVVGLRKIKQDSEVKLTLEDRPGGGPAGQGTLRVVNTPEIKRQGPWLMTLRKLIGKDIWGGGGEIMLGDTKLADREGYTAIRLCEGWREVIENHSKE